MRSWVLGSIAVKLRKFIVVGARCYEGVEVIRTVEHVPSFEGGVTVSFDCTGKLKWLLGGRGK